MIVMAAAGVGRWPGARRAELVVDAFPPDRRKRDLDNILKPLLDVIEAYGLVEDDVLIKRIVIEERAVEPPGRVDVTLTVHMEG